MNDICHDLQTDLEMSVPKAIAQEILTSLFNQKASGQFCDVQFLHGSASVWAHSCVLASYSPFMMRLFNKYTEENLSWSFNKPMQVNISSVSKCNGSSRNNCVACTCKIIDFIYTGKIKLDAEHLDHVVNLSINLEIDVLLLICQRYKRDNFSLLDSLATSNQISAGNSCEDIVDMKAYVDNLNSSISYRSKFKEEQKMHLDAQSYKKNIISGADRKEDISNSEQIQENESMVNRTDRERHSTNVLSMQKSLKQKKDLVCTACNFKSPSSFKFKQHKQVFHKRNYICLECSFTSFKMGDVLEHLLKSSHGGKTCSICLFEANTSLELRNHFGEHGRSYPFRCSLCKQRFKYRNDWVRHKYSPFHEKELYTAIEKLNITLPEEEKRNFACRICKYEFCSNELLQKHSHIFHKRKYVCLSCDFNSFKIESIIEHLTGDEHEENVCSICLFVADNITNLKDHLLEHKNSLPFPCTICGARFQTRNEWWRHELAHGSDKPFKCQYCELSFQTSPYLKTHILYRHKQKKHTCKICGYGAPFASKLEKHSMTHDNKYKCGFDNCTFNCSSEGVLKKHKKAHISKPLSCPLCSLTFKFAKNMKRHVKLIHNKKDVSLKCPSCDYSNSRIDKMKEHCKNMHAEGRDIFEEVHKQYEGIKTYQLPEIIKKARRTQQSKDKNDTDTPTIKNEISEISKDKLTESIVDASKTSENHVVNNALKQTVFLSEATSELNILCENEGTTIPVASVTSTNMLTIGNFREGTGSVTLNEATGVLTLNNINIDSKGAVFLNESTGVLSYINLNVENGQDNNNMNSIPDSKPEQIQLNEVTGEITTVTEETGLPNNNVNNTTEEDFPFDTYGFDFNEESCDGFDDFDSLFFDTFSPIDPSTNVEEMLKGSSNELFGPCEHIPRLDEMTGELTFAKDSLEHPHNITGENIPV